MTEMKLGAVETRFAELVWQHAPLPSGKLVALCRETLGWKKPTTYTVLRKLCEKGLFENRDGMVHVLLTQEAFRAVQSEQFVSRTCGGSLPAFIAAFTSRNRLSAEQAEEIRRMIDAAVQEQAP